MALKKIAPVKPLVRVNKVKIVENSADGLVVQFPPQAADYLKLKGKETDLFAIPTAGVVQLSAEVPSLAVPVSADVEEAFTAH